MAILKFFGGEMGEGEGKVELPRFLSRAAPLTAAGRAAGRRGDRPPPGSCAVLRVGEKMKGS
jgi:hypothetical protein